MTPPPVASLGLERPSITPSAPAASTASVTNSRSAARARAAERVTATESVLECVWRVGRGGELVLRLALPHDHAASAPGELSFTPAARSDRHPLIDSRDALGWNTARRWRIEARRDGECGYDLRIREAGDVPSDEASVDLGVVLGVVLGGEGGGDEAPPGSARRDVIPATIATIVRGEVAEVGRPQRAEPLVLTSIPSAIGLRGGSYVLRSAALQPRA